VLLVDTSAWVEYLRDTGSRASEEVGRLAREDAGELATTPPVVMELLAGATSAAGLAALERLTAGLPCLPIEPALDWYAAATVYRAARRGGTTVRGLVDCLIVVVAQRHAATLVHRDADLAALSGLLAVRHVDLR
jgi:predicted nucleic acid-binding protein